MAYIDKEKLIEFLRNTRLHLPKESKDFFTRDEMLLNFEQYVNLIEPAADVLEVRHGEWDINSNCSVCGVYKFEELDADVWADWDIDYCPNCGAKMDGKDGE